MGLLRAVAWGVALLLLVAPSHGADVYGGEVNKVIKVDDTFNGFNALQGTTVLIGALSIETSFCSNAAFSTNAEREAALTTAFGNVKEIRGFFTFYAKDCVTTLGFLSNLAYIRGLQLSNGFALYVEGGESASGLRYFGLKSLMQVANGNININGAPGNTGNGLCGKGNANPDKLYQGADLAALIPGTIKTDNLGTSKRIVTKTFGGVDRTLEYDQDVSTPGGSSICLGPLPSGTTQFCHPDCNGRCWLPNDANACQTVCPPGCSAVSGCRPNGITCCPASCAGGCDANGVCNACQEDHLRAPDGSCVLECPAGQKQWGTQPSPDTSCQGAIENPFACVTTCPSGTFVLQNSCVNTCPSGNVVPSTNVCAPDPDGRKLCPLKDLVCKPQLAAVRYSDCDTIPGTINIYSGSSLLSTTKLERDILQKIRFIRGALIVTDTDFGDLSFLKNVEEIGGDVLSVAGAQKVIGIRRNDDMTFLGLDKLYKIADLVYNNVQFKNTVIIRNNLKLCFLDTIDFNEMVSDPAYLDLQLTYETQWVKDNVAQAAWDNYFNRTTSLSFCSEEVHSFEADIIFHNISVANLTLEYQLQAREDIADHLDRAPQSIELGNIVAYGSGGSKMKIKAVDFFSQPVAETKKAELPGTNFADILGTVTANPLASQTSEADPCDSNCAGRGCWGEGEFQCQVCGNNQTLRNGECVDSCDGDNPVPSYFKYDQDPDFCLPCHFSCGTCSGTTPTDCLTCASNKVLRSDGTCALGCPSAEYKNGGVCAECHDTCAECDGPNANDCTKCYTDRALFQSTCVTTCPAGTFKSVVNGPECQALEGSQGSSGQQAAIAGSVAGGIALLIFAAVVLFVLLPRARQRQVNPYVNDLAPVCAPVIGGDEWELDRSRITLGKIIGSGNFGQVHKALYSDPEAEAGEPAIDVAVKVLKRGAAGSTEEREFHSEMKLMKEIGYHQHVISLVGCCTLVQPLWLVVEYADHGSLQSYLRERRPTAKRAAGLNSEDFANFSVQIAHGMSYLAKLKVIHRDLAARNILVCANLQLKVADFGLAKDVYEEDFYQKTTSGNLPLKWMAPESLIDRVFTTASDVWSFGVTMWEIYEFGATPYPTTQNREILDFLKAGYRMPRPQTCPEEIYAVMVQTWQFYPDDRPSFPDLVKQLAALGGVDISAFKDGYSKTRSPLVDPEGMYEQPVMTGSGDGGPDSLANPMYEDATGLDDGAYEEPVNSGSGYLRVTADDSVASGGAVYDMAQAEPGSGAVKQPVYDMGQNDNKDGPAPGQAVYDQADDEAARKSQYGFEGEDADTSQTPLYDNAA